MIEQKIKQSMNEQLNREFYSAYFYLSMSAWCESQVLKGMANWFMAKYQEEMAHGMKIYRYLLDQGADVELLAVDKPPATFEDIGSVFGQTLAHEQEVTGHINELMDLAQELRDHATQIFLHWFITEQIEEEAVVSDIISRLKLVGDKGEGLFMLDSELGRMAESIQQTLATEVN